MEEGYILSQLNFIFCSDDYLLEINQRYLNHDYYTDIITFDNSSTKGEIEGDIFISIERVKDNIKDQDTSFDNELLRVIIHGVLHLQGWKDSTPTLKSKMRAKESELIQKFTTFHVEH